MNLEFGILEEKDTAENKNKQSKTAEERNKLIAEERQKNENHEKGKYPNKFTRTILEWHEVFSVKPNATLEEVKLRYRTLARQWHPDVCDDPIAEEKMKVLNNAYDEFLIFKSL